MRIRNSVCKRTPSLRTKFAVDMSYLMLTNIMAVSAMVLWSHALTIPFSYIAAIDTLFGITTERWLTKVIISYDNTTPHPGGAVGKTMITQRMTLMCIIATVTRGYSAAIASVMKDMFTLEEQPSELSIILLIPCIYTLLRTIALDIDIYHPGSLRTQIPIEDHSEFTIGTDDEDEERPPPPTPTTSPVTSPCHSE